MEEWKEVRLGDYIQFQNGYAFKSSDFQERGKYKIVKIKELKDGGVKFFSDTACIDIQDFSVYEKYSIENDDVLFALTGDPVSKPNPLSWVGRVSIYKRSEKALLNQRTCKIIKSDKIDNKFLYYYFRQWENFYALASKATGSASQANISTTTIADTIINLPPLPTQQKIAAILSSLDDKIELNNKINENLEQQAQAIFEEKFGLFKIAHNESEKITLPNNWLYYSFDSLCSQIKPGTNFQPTRVTEGIPFLNVRNITEGYINKSDIKFISTEDFMKVHKTWVPEENDILLSRIGTLGLVAVIRKTDLPLAVHYNFIDIKVSKIPFEFLYFLLKSENFKNVYKLITKQSVQEYVTIDEVAALSIPLPKLENYDYKKFNIFKNLYKQIETNQLENAQLTIIRDSLLPKLMNGEIEV